MRKTPRNTVGLVSAALPVAIVVDLLLLTSLVDRVTPLVNCAKGLNCIGKNC